MIVFNSLLTMQLCCGIGVHSSTCTIDRHAASTHAQKVAHKQRQELSRELPTQLAMSCAVSSRGFGDLRAQLTGVAIGC